MKKKHLSAIIAIALCAVLLFNLTACNGNKNKDCSHTYGEWIVDTAATCVSYGSRHHACTQCGHREDEDIQPLGDDGHSFVNGVCEYCNMPQEEVGGGVPLTDTAKIRLTAPQPIVGVATTIAAEIDAADVCSYNVEVEANNDVGISAYKSGELSVSFESNVDGYGVMDTITVDDEISVEQSYYVQNDGLALGEIYADYYEVEIDYTENGMMAGLYYYDTYYIYKYDSNGRISEIYKNGELYKQFAYNANGNIITETTNGLFDNFSKTYDYTLKGELQAVNGQTVYGIIITGDTTVTLSYDYEFRGTKYLTAKLVDDVETTYSYVGDRISALQTSHDTVEYILDNELNYIGLKYNGEKYYFAVDPFGNVMALLDCDGNIKVEYEHDIWGNVVSVSGELKDTLGQVNEIVNLNGIYDFALGVYNLADGIYIPEYGITIQKGTASVLQTKSMYEWEQNGYFARSAVTSFANIHDKVVEVVVENLEAQGMDVVSGLYATDKAGNNRRLVDIYTLDYSITPFSAMNLVDGNQIYEVIYKPHNSEEEFYKRAQDKVSEISKNWAVSYFAEYIPDAGTMTFDGQFIYNGKLISYSTIPSVGGVVAYEVLNNNRNFYNENVNIFDYDANRYVNFVNNTFDLNFLDGVTIIPGISRETYDVIDNFLEDKLQSVAGNICDQMLIYDDPSFYSSLEANNAKDYWSQMNLGPDATTSYLEIQADGSVQVKTMPVWETDGFATKILIGAGVILVTACVAAISVVIPGAAGCVISSICVGAAKLSAAWAVKGFAFGFLQGAAGELFNQLLSGNGVAWNDVFEKAIDSAATGFMTGAITGAVMGGIQGGLNPTYCFAKGTPVVTTTGAVAIENISVGDRVLSYDYSTGQQSYQPVISTSVRQTEEVIYLTVDGERIVTTPNHPFYVVNDDIYHGYTAAEYLSVGDQILASNGDCVIVTAVERQTFNEPINVYNFTVEYNHSYYVGENKLLVHNAYGCQPGTNPNKRPKYYSEHRGRSEAFRAAKREAGIPMGQQPIKVMHSVNRYGVEIPGRTYVYEHNGGIIEIMEHAAGHIFKDNELGPHFNLNFDFGSGVIDWHFFYPGGVK